MPIAPYTIVGDFNTTLSSNGPIKETQINRERVKLTEVINQMDLAIICRPFYPNTTEKPFFSAPFPKLTIYSVTNQTSAIKED